MSDRKDKLWQGRFSEATDQLVEQYTESVASIAADVPQVDADATEWLPLGVFALTNSSGVDPTMYVQLAVSKEGVLEGTYHNSSTNSTLQLSTCPE